MNKFVAVFVVGSFRAHSFQHSIGLYQHRKYLLKHHMSNMDENIDIKAELTAYLKKREVLGADEIAKSEVGKVIGGTKGNAVLDFISVSPKTSIIEDVPDVFDYGELERYGFGYLVKPIMDAGGRSEMYPLMGLPTPPSRIKPKKSVPKLVIDKTGETDKARYSGLKVTQILNDDEMGQRLAEAQRKKKEGENLRPKLIEEGYEIPFSDKVNTGPKMTPEWTPQKLDEEGRRAGRALSWAREARAGEYQKDPYECLNIEGSLQLYSIASVLFVSFAFGNSTPNFLGTLNFADQGNSILNIIQGPALGIILASISSSIFCAAVLAPGKERSAFAWGLKGLAGGPLAILQLRELEILRTRGEIEKDSSSL